MSRALKALSPAYFALVMATGIVSLAAHMLGLRFVALALLWINSVAYVVLFALNIARAAVYPRAFFGDMTDHYRGPGFFTAVAASSVLGSQLVLISGHYELAVLLWAASIVLWIALTYTIFAAFTIKDVKPSLDLGINGSWLLAVVATQAVAALAALIAAHSTQPVRLGLNFFALSMWLWGGMLYIWMISLIFYRYTFFKFSPDDLAPPYWINMGAMAISTLTGTRLILNAPDAPFLLSQLAFLKGFTILYWATGTWWIPMLIVLALWRYVYKRRPLVYDPLYWGAVFPLGMYSACTFSIAEVMQLHFLDGVAHVFFYVALVAWGAAFFGLVRTLVTSVGNVAGRSSGAE
jgi:tellurite resistance protein TehA-like permease